MTTVRNSERSSWTRCRQQWWWGYKEKLKSNVSKTALEFGTLIHNALELRYPPGLVRGPDCVLCWEAVWQDFLQKDIQIYGVWADGEYEDLYELGLEMMYNYQELYGADSQWRVIQPEMPFQVELENGVTVVGQIDAVVQDMRTRQYGLLEHKTIAGLPPGNYWFPMEEQPGTYLLFGPDYLHDAGLLPKNVDLEFVFYNFLKKGKADQRPTNELGQSLNQNGSVSKNQPGPLFHREIVHRSKRELGSLYDRWILQTDEISAAHAGKVPIYKVPRGDCSYMCQFKDLCELHDLGAGHYEVFQEAQYRSWDPYDAHTIALEEASR